MRPGRWGIGRWWLGLAAARCSGPPGAIGSRRGYCIVTAVNQRKDVADILIALIEDVHRYGDFLIAAAHAVAIACVVEAMADQVEPYLVIEDIDRNPRARRPRNTCVRKR